LSEVLAKRVNL